MDGGCAAHVASKLSYTGTRYQPAARMIIPQQLGPVATPTPDKHEILTLTCNWQVENEVRADRLTKEARDFSGEQSKQTTDAMPPLLGPPTAPAPTPEDGGKEKEAQQQETQKRQEETQKRK